MYHKQTTRHAAKGMTLVELLIVISIIIMLVSILMPSFNEVRRSIYATKSKARIAELATGIASFKMENNFYPGQDSLADFFSGDKSGSSALADALFPVVGSKRQAKYAPLNDDDLQEIDEVDDAIWDRFHPEDIMAIVYYPAQPGATDLGQFKENHNNEHTNGHLDNEGWQYPDEDKGPGDPFQKHIKDRRFKDDKSETPYNAGEFILIAPGKDRKYGTNFDCNNFGN